MRKIILLCAASVLVMATARSANVKKGSIYTDLPLVEMVDSATFRDVRLSDIVGRDGKLTLIDFWFVGCGYCGMALPALGEIGAEYAEKLNVVSIHTAGATPQQIEAYRAAWPRYTRKAEALGLSLHTNLFDSQGAAYKAFKLEGWPSYVLFDREGKVLAAWFGGYQKKAFLNKIMKYLK